MAKKNNDMMTMKENKMLVEVITGGFMGSIAGIILGLILGLLIWFIAGIVASADPQSFSTHPPVTAIAFLGMGFGAVIGAVFGSVVGLKQRK